MTTEKPLIVSDHSHLPAGTTVIESVASMLAELYYVRHPVKKGTPEGEVEAGNFVKNHSSQSIFIYYPWLKTAVHSLREDMYLELRTARNRELITAEDQAKYRSTKVGIAGLSVGSGILHSLVISGGPKTIRLADFDVIEATNLNRIRARLVDMGAAKTDVAAKQVWELDPFADLTLYQHGVTLENLEEFINGLDFFIDEMDSLDLKLKARLICKEKKIPVLMCTDNGDTVILDVERYDTDPDQKPFFGNAGDLTMEDLTDRSKWLRYATQIVDPTFTTDALQESLLKLKGRGLAGLPQLGTTAGVAGAAISYAIRRISSGHSLPADRYTISLEEKLIPEYTNPKNIADRATKALQFKEEFSR